MITLKVYGELKKILGGKKIHTFHNCYNMRQLLSAITSNFPKFEKYLIDNALNPFYLILNKATSISKETIGMQNFKDGDEIRLVPITNGSGDDWGSVLSIIIGIVLIYFGQVGYFGQYASAAYAMGASMILSGVSQLLFKPEVIEPSTYEASDAKNSTSYAFSGPINLTSQGNAVPVGYGRLMIGSQVIGAGLFNQNI